MNDNSFEVISNKEGIREFIKSSIESSKIVIEHYDFVINDISSDISDATLESTKGPTLVFFKKMKKCWADFKSDLEKRLIEIENK